MIVSEADLWPYVRTCGSCDASIVWARTMTGRSMPVDPAVSDSGNVVLENRQGHLRATIYTAEMIQRHLSPEDRRMLRTSHFATCPDADTWRKREHS